MKSSFALLTVTACLLPFAAHASEIININALCSSGETVHLDAGTYEVKVIGTSQGGLYNGWDFATANFGTSSGKPAANDWVDSFDITANGVETSYLPSGNPASSSATGALSSYQSSMLFANGKTQASSSPDTVYFTLNSSQCVNFKVADSYFSDNWGGTSLELTPATPATTASATPEPSTIGLMGLSLIGAAAAIRRKITKQ